MTMTTNAALVVLVRHGRTALNAAGRLRGHADPELDDVGRAEVAATARALARYGFRSVISSPLRRATATAAAIAAGGIEVTVDDAFMDRDYGQWTAHLKTEVVDEWGSVDAAPGVEPAAALLSRARAGLDRHASDGVAIAIVTHDAVIRALLGSIRPGVDPMVETASWAVLERAETGWRIESFDNTATDLLAPGGVDPGRLC